MIICSKCKLVKNPKEFPYIIHRGELVQTEHCFTCWGYESPFDAGEPPKKLKSFYLQAVKRYVQVMSRLAFNHPSNCQGPYWEFLGTSPAEFRRHLWASCGLKPDEGVYVHIEHIEPLSGSQTVQEMIRRGHYTNTRLVMKRARPIAKPVELVRGILPYWETKRRSRSQDLPLVGEKEEAAPQRDMRPSFES